MQLLAGSPPALTAAPDFAFDLAAARTSDEDMAGLDLADVLNVLSGSERVHVATLRRFAQRFGRLNLRERALRPVYGLAEATLFFVAGREPGDGPHPVSFDPQNLIVRGRNHYPDDIEATIAEITGGRAAAIAIAIEQDRAEQLVAIVEVRTGPNPKTGRWTSSAPSSVKSSQPSPQRTSSGPPTSSWSSAARSRSPPAARSDGRPAPSCTEIKGFTRLDDEAVTAS